MIIGVSKGYYVEMIGSLASNENKISNGLEVCSRRLCDIDM